MGSLNADQDAGHYFSNGTGASGYQGNAKDDSSQLFQALLKQTMGQQQGGNYGIGNAIAQALQTYLSAGGNFGMGGKTVDTGNPGASLGTVSLPDSSWST